MDHLPYPPASRVEPVQVEYLCDGYDMYTPPNDSCQDENCLCFFPWTSYPYRKGWQRHGRRWWDCDTEDIDEPARRAQSWLFFDLLQDFLEDHYDQALFLRESEQGVSLVHTQNLESLVTKLSGKNGATKDWKTTRRLLDRVHDRCEDLDSKLPNHPAISFSITTLLSTLQYATECAILSTQLSPVVICLDTGLKSKLLMERLRDGGWCEFWLQKIAPRLSLLTLYYLSGIYLGTSAACHSECDAEKCKAYDASGEVGYTLNAKGKQRGQWVYRQRHDLDHQEPCEQIGPKHQRVAKIIQSGGVPLLKWDKGAEVIEVVRATSAMKFVAVSHAWSGGWGGPTNYIPKCQLKTLSKLIEQIPHRRVSNQFRFRRNHIVAMERSKLRNARIWLDDFGA